MNNETIKAHVWKAGLVVGILLAVFLLVLSIKELKRIPYVGRDVPIMNAITVIGKGEAVSIPNVATFSFSVTETGKTVADAQTKATTKINSTLAALKDAKIAEKDIKTISYNINPHYDYQNGVCTTNYCQPGKSVLTGYDVSQTIEVKIRDLEKAGEIFSTIGSLNVQNVNGLNFAIDDIETVKAEARKLAIENAQQKADDLAKQLGVRLVRITGFYDQSDDQPYYYGRDVAMEGMAVNQAVKAVPPQIPSGEQKTISRVSITYEIR
jgi:uncharacterized protein